MTYSAYDVEQAIENEVTFDGWGEIKYAAKGSVIMMVTLNDERVQVVKADDFGGVNQGSELWVVVQVGDQFFKKDGYYASHYGSDWDGEVTEVTPEDKVVTVYNNV